MPRVHCLMRADGTPDWPWIIAQIVLLVGIVVGYSRIYLFWRRMYLLEAPEDRNHKLMEMANIFLWCAICGYGMSLLIFVWPAYRLLTIFLFVLNVMTWRFNLTPGELAISLQAKRLQRELEARNQELENLVRAQGEALHLVNVAAARSEHPTAIISDSSAVLWANDSFKQLHPDEEVTGRPLLSLLTKVRGLDFAALAHAVDAHQPFRADAISQRSDGEHSITVELEWIVDEAGLLRGVLAKRDTTEQTAAKRQRDHLHALINASTDLIRSVDADGRVLFDNAASQALRGQAASLHAGRTPDAIAALEAVSLPAALKHGSWTGESTLVGADGAERPVSEVLMAECGPSGQLLSVSSMMRDISALKAAQSAAEAAVRARSRFLDTVSHELRTPLNGVIGALGLIEPERLPDSQRRYVQIAQTSGRALLFLINDILDYSKIEAGEMELCPETFSPTELLEEATAVISTAAAEKGLELIWTVAPEVPSHLEGDPARLRQILLNLLSNAVKFTASGTVTVEATQEAGAIGFRVTDTGVGISAADQAKLFQPFSQVGTSSAARASGTGLGLAISRRLIALMGGEMGCTSAPGSGSTFWLRVPLASAAPPVAAPPEPFDGSVSGMRVLVAEDNPINQLLLRDQLLRMGVSCVIAADGEEAIRHLRGAEPFDLVLMDCQMPKLDGYEATRWLRAMAASGDIAPLPPIYALTASTSSVDRAASRAAGMDAHLTKPVSSSALYEALKKIHSAQPRDRAAG